MLGQEARAAATRMVRAQSAWAASRPACPDATLRYGTLGEDWRLTLDGYGDAFPVGTYSFLEGTCVVGEEFYGGQTAPGGADDHVHGLSVETPAGLLPGTGDRVLVAWLNGLSEPCVLGRVTRALPPAAAEAHRARRGSGAP